MTPAGVAFFALMCVAESPKKDFIRFDDPAPGLLRRIGDVPFGGPSLPDAFAVSADRKLVALGYEYFHAVNVYEYPSGKFVASLVRTPASLLRFCGGLLLCGSRDQLLSGGTRELRVWDLKAGTSRTIPSFRWDCTADAKTLLVTRARPDDFDVVRVDAFGGKETPLLTAEKGLLGPLAISPDGNEFVVSVNKEGRLRRYSTSDGKPLGEIDAGPVAPMALAFLPNQGLLSVGLADKVPAGPNPKPPPVRLRLWSIPEGKTLRDFNLKDRTSSPYQIMVRRDGTLSVGPFGPYEVFDPAKADAIRRDVSAFGAVTADGETMGEAKIPQNRLYPVRFEQGGKILVTRTWADNRERLWDVATGKGLPPHPGPPRGPFPTPPYSGTESPKPGRRPFAGGHVAWAEGELRVEFDDKREPWTVAAWDAKTPTTQRPFAAEVSPDGRWLLTRSAIDNTAEPKAELWDVATRTKRSMVPYQSNRHGDGVRFSPCGRLLLMSQFGGPEPLKLVEISTGIPRWTDGLGRDCVLSPDGRSLAATSPFGVIELLDLTHGAKRPTEATDIDRLWNDLMCDEGTRGQRAVWSLSLDPDAALKRFDREWTEMPKVFASDVKDAAGQIEHPKEQVRRDALAFLGSLGALALADVGRLPDSPARRELEGSLRQSPFPRHAVVAGRYAELLHAIDTPAARERLVKMRAESVWLR